jgi:uncharacterized integral membrane protein
VADDPHQTSGDDQRRHGTNWRLWLVGIAVLLLLVVALQNSQEVEVQFLFIETHAPMFAILLMTAALGAAIGYVSPLLRRHRREERRRHGG